MRQFFALRDPVAVCDTLTVISKSKWDSSARRVCERDERPNLAVFPADPGRCHLEFAKYNADPALRVAVGLL